MDSHSDPEQREAFATFLYALALALFGVFSVTALASALPLQLLEPGWQLRFSSSLIDNGPIAALGLIAAWLAALLHPSPGRDQSRLAKLRQGALVAALGYLLLVPLQVSAAWRGLTQLLGAEQQEQQRITRQLAELDAVVRNAPSGAAIQRQWSEARGPQLSGADLSQPLPQLRAELLARLEQARMRLNESGRLSRQRTRLWEVVQNSLRLCGSALFLALGFAAAAPNQGRRRALPRPSPWAWAWFNADQTHRRRNQGRHRRIEDEAYLDQITPGDGSPRS